MIPWARAVAVLWGHTVCRTLGVGRSAGARAVAAGVLLLAYIPAAVSVGVPVLLERYAVTADTPLALERIRTLALDASFVPQYWQYFEITAAVVVVFTALVGPSATTEDRTDGMLPVYAQSPLGIGGYLTGKWLASASLLLLVTAGPLLMLLAGNVLTGNAGADAGNVVATGGRLLLAASMVAGLHGAITVGAGLLARSRSEAVLLVTMALIGISSLVRVATADGGTSFAHALDAHRLALSSAARIVGGNVRTGTLDPSMAAAVVFAWAAAWLTAGWIRLRAEGTRLR